MGKKKARDKITFAKFETAGFIQPRTFDYVAYYKSEGISKIINSYFNNYELLIEAIHIFLLEINNPPGFSNFEARFENVNFDIDINDLCELISIYLTNEPTEYFHKIISNKIEKTETIILNMGESEKFNEYKTQKILNGKEVSLKKLDSTKVCLLSDEVCPNGYIPEIAFEFENDTRIYYNSYGTLENFYNAIFAIFKEAKERINDLVTINETQSKGHGETPDSNSSETPENPYPVIFKNVHAYNMFIELKNLTVKDNSIVADYSFIFHKMKHKDFKAVNQNVTEPMFIEFLRVSQNADISVVKLPFKNPDYKQPIYSTVLDKFKGLI